MISVLLLLSFIIYCQFVKNHDFIILHKEYAVKLGNKLPNAGKKRRRPKFSLLNDISKNNIQYILEAAQMCTMTRNILEEYKDLRTNVLKLRCSREQLESLKKLHSLQINSPRRLYYITSLEELINVLERRASIDQDNTKLLHGIAKYLGLDISLLNEKCQIITDPTQKKINVENESSKTNMQQNKKSWLLQKAYDKVASDIGKKWKDMARALNIKENELDEITYRHTNDLKSQVYAVFAIFEQREDERDRIHMLCNALDKARRKDLRQDIEKILFRNI